MSLLLPFIAVGALGAVTAVADRRKKELAKAQESEVQTKEVAFEGTYIPFGKVAASAPYLDVEDIRADVSSEGTPIFLVRYAGLSNWVLQYHHPANNRL